MDTSYYSEEDDGEDDREHDREDDEEHYSDEDDFDLMHGMSTPSHHSGARGSNAGDFDGSLLPFITRNGKKFGNRTVHSA